MKTLKVGDRVVAYGHGWYGVGAQSSTSGRVAGMVLEIKSRSTILIRPDRPFPVLVTSECVAYNIKQLRRLKPKRKTREFWIPMIGNDVISLAGKSVYKERPIGLGNTVFIHVREVGKK